MNRTDYLQKFAEAFTHSCLIVLSYGLAGFVTNYAQIDPADFTIAARIFIICIFMVMIHTCVQPLLVFRREVNEEKKS